MEQIVRVKQAHENGTATVFLQRESACSGDCHKCSGCGAAKEVMVFEARNPIGARRGDLVVIESKTGPVMKAVGVFYVLPLVLFFLGFFLGDAFCGRGSLFGSLGFVAAIALTVVYDRKIAKKEEVHTITGYARGHVPGTVNKGDNELD
jgi:sigma-E factor negative regulatory protein RseC